MNKLYILVRTDLSSMTTGRIAAQCSHAANQFVGEAKDIIEMVSDPSDTFTEAFNNWENQTDSYFGTVIVLNGGTQDDIMNKLSSLDYERFMYSLVIDPDYPIRDGEHVWTIPNVLTCAFVFPYGDDDNLVLRDMKLL